MKRTPGVSPAGTALVTGGASGIGLEISHLLARQNWDLIIVGRRQHVLDSAAEELSGNGIYVRTASFDLGKPGAPEDLFTWCKESGPGVDLLVNNAGSGIFGKSTESDPEELSAMIQLNITALTILSNLFSADMAERGYGYILNVGSLAGNQPLPFFASYGATKSYVLHFSLALRAELAGSGVSVTCLQPGYVRTEFDDNAGIESEAYRKFSRKNGMTAEAVAKAGLKALFNKKSHSVAGFRNKAAAFLSGIVPLPATAAFMYKVIRTLIGEHHHEA